MSAPTELRYQTWPPGPVLARYVEHFWAVEGPPLPNPHREVLIPNGRPTILLCLGDPGRRFPMDSANGIDNVSNAAGLLTRPILLEQQGRSSYVAAQLQPWGLKAFGLAPLVDATLPLADWLGRQSVEALEVAARATPFGAERTAPLRLALESRLVPFTDRTLALLGRVASLAADADAERDIASVAADLGLNYSALYHLMRSHVGVSLRQYRSILRFYGFCGSLLREPRNNLALLASLEGYYDQPHATREFRRYTGMTQRRFRTMLNGIARLMHELS